jgi:hypothetical protein
LPTTAVLICGKNTTLHILNSINSHSPKTIFESNLRTPILFGLKQIYYLRIYTR